MLEAETVTQGAAIPEYIPAAFVRNFNLFDTAQFSENLHDSIAALAAEERDLLYTPANGGQWVVVGRKAAFDASSDHVLFSSDFVSVYGEIGESTMIPIHLDPPHHSSYRKVLTDIFSAKTVVGFDGLVRRQAAALIDAVADTGRCDFAKAVAEPLPVLFFMTMMGFPTERFDEFRSWVLAGLSEPDGVKREEQWAKVHAMSADLIRARQAKREDDLISRLIDTPIDGRPLSFEELQSLCLMLFIAGLDTVTNAMSLIMRHLAQDLPLQEQLRQEPRLITAAVEELLRRYSANTITRYVAQDGEFYGAPLRRGDFVLVHFPAANLDPREADEPLKVDLSRKAAHLSFGAGIHRCVGAQLARVEMKAMLEEWLKRIPAFTLDPDRPWAFHTGFVFSIDALPLVWDEMATT